MPDYRIVREWDDTLHRVEVVPKEDGDVFMIYDDGLTHKVTRAYVDGITEQVCCSVCGDARELVAAPGEWPSCPGCGTN